MRLGWIVLGVSVFFMLISLTTAEAKIWSDDACATYCRVRSDAWTFCNSENCPAPQCTFNTYLSSWYKHGYSYCISSGKDDITDAAEQAMCNKMFEEQKNDALAAHQKNNDYRFVGFFCSKSTDSNGDTYDSEKSCQWKGTTRYGAWALTEVKCQNGCNPNIGASVDTSKIPAGQTGVRKEGVCNNECSNPWSSKQEGQSKCDIDLRVRCWNYCPQAIQPDDAADNKHICDPSTGISWLRWTYPYEIIGSTIVEYCEWGCQEYTDPANGVHKAKCKDSCTQGEKRCFSLSLTDMGQFGHNSAMSREVRECTYDSETKKYAYMRNKDTKLCPFGCENIDIMKTDPKTGQPTKEVLKYDARCKNTESYACDQLCKTDAKKLGDSTGLNLGDNYALYSQGMCINAKNPPPFETDVGCNVFGSSGSVAYALPDDTQKVCDSYDFYAIKQSDLEEAADNLASLKASNYDISFGSYKCNDLLVDHLDLCDKLKSQLTTTEEVFILVVSGSDRAHAADWLDRLVYSLNRAIYLEGDDAETVYSDYNAKFGTRKMCCCSSPYRALQSGVTNAPVAQKYSGEKDYSQAEKDKNLVSSCEVACWRYYDKQLTLDDIYNNLVEPGSKYNTANELLSSNVGTCVSIDKEKIKTAWKESDPYPDICSKGFVPAGTYDYNLIEGADSILTNSPHCPNSDATKVSACCCRVYAPTPEAQLVIAYMNEYRKFLEATDADLKKQMETAVRTWHWDATAHGNAFDIIIKRADIKNKIDFSDKVVERVKQDPNSAVSVIGTLASLKRINVYFQDGQSYATLLINVPALQSDLVAGAASITFSVGGAYFDKHYFFASSVQAGKVVVSGKDCTRPVTEQSTTLADATDDGPYRIVIDDNGDVVPVSGFSANANSYSDLVSKASDVNYLFTNFGSLPLSHWESTKQLSDIPSDERNNVWIEISDTYDDDSHRHFYKTLIHYKHDVITSETHTVNYNCGTYGTQTGVTYSGAFGYSIKDVFRLKNAQLTPIFRLDTKTVNSEGKPEARLGLDIIFSKTSDDGLKKLDIDIFGSTNILSEKQDTGHKSYMGGISFSYKKLDKPQGVPEFWYDSLIENLYDPVKMKFSSKYTEQIGARWDEYVLPQIQMKEAQQLSNTDIEAVKAYIRQKVFDTLTEDKVYGGVFVTSNDNNLVMNFDQVIVGYLGVQKRINVLNDIFSSVVANTYLATEIPTLMSNKESFAGTSNSVDDEQSKLIAFTAHADVKGYFQNRGYVSMFTDIKLTDLTQSTAGFELLSYAGNDWWFQVRLATPFSDLHQAGIEVSLNGDMFWGILNRFGVRWAPVSGEPQLIINSAIPLGFANVIMDAYRYLYNGVGYMLHDHSKELDVSVPSSQFGVSRATDNSVIWNFMGGSATPVVNKWIINFNPILSINDLKTTFNVFTEKQKCAMGCQALADGRVGCVEDLKESGTLTANSKLCSNNGENLQKLFWPKEYPYEHAYTCSVGCNSGSCVGTCTEGQKMCSPDKWHLMTCFSTGSEMKYVASECEFGCMTVDGKSSCRGISCISETQCTAGARRCNGDNVEECQANVKTGVVGYVKISQCMLGCDQNNVQGQYACFEDNVELQKKCNAAADKSKVLRCTADGMHMEMCIEKHFKKFTSINDVLTVVDSDKTGYVFAENPDGSKTIYCEYGCYADKCLTKEEANKLVGYMYCSPDKKNILGYGLVNGNPKVTVTPCESGKECSLYGWTGLPDGSNKIPEGTMRCSDDGLYVNKYTSGEWKVVGKKCALGCDPIPDSQGVVMCKEEVKCDSKVGSPTFLRCSADGLSIERCTNDLIGMVTDFELNPDGTKKKPLLGECAYGLCIYENGAAKCYQPTTTLGIVINPTCSPDGMYRIYKTSNDVTQRVYCDFGCDPATKQCKQGGCSLGAETCISGSVNKCVQATTMGYAVPSLGDTQVLIRLTMRGVYGNPTVVAVECDDYSHDKRVSPKVTFLKDISQDELNKNTKLDMNLPDIKLKISQGTAPLLYEELREIRCTIYLFPEKQPNALIITKDGTDPEIDKGKNNLHINEIPATGSFNSGKFEYYFKEIGKSMPTRTIVVGGISVRILPTGTQRVKEISDRLPKTKASLPQVFSESYCTDKKAITNSLVKCGWGEGDCDAGLSHCDTGLDCKQGNNVYGIKALKPDELFSLDICCRPWEKVFCAKQKQDRSCEVPVCVPDPAIVTPGTSNYCKWHMLPESEGGQFSGAKCGYGDGACSNDDECGTMPNDKDPMNPIPLKCVKNVDNGLTSGWLSSSHPKLCCKEGEVAMKMSDITHENKKISGTGYTCWSKDAK